MTLILGLDESKYQDKPTDWTKAKAEQIKFAIIRACQGIYPDVMFPVHWSTSAGQVWRGSYHYYRDYLTPQAQAKKYYDTVNATGDLGELPPILDIEEIDNPTLTPSKIKATLEEIEQLFQRTPFAYTRASVWNPKIGNVAWASHYPLWVVHYPYAEYQGEDHIAMILSLDPSKFPALPSPWKTEGYTIWQIGDCFPASQYGVSGNNLGLNLGDEEKINALITGNSPPTPPPAGEEMHYKVIVPKLNIRLGTSKFSLDLGDLWQNEIVGVFETIPDGNGNQWARLGLSQFAAINEGSNTYLIPTTEPITRKLI